MLFILGVIFIIITLGIVVYNKPKNQPVLEAILDSTDNLYVDRAHLLEDKKKDKKDKKKKDKKKKKNKKEEPNVVIGDDCSGSLECPSSLGNGGMKNEQRCRKILERIFGKPFPSVRPNWLKNPATKRNLELDMYCHKLEFTNSKGQLKQVRLAAEYDGKQHTAMTGFHANKKQLLYQMKRDQYKEKRCKELGVTLIRIPYWAKQDLEGYITRKLKDADLIPQNFS